jgi:metal-sulfur cluster biosynthetic enzyme
MNIEMKTQKEKMVWDVLQPICDPELGASIVDLGLIYEVNVEGNIVKVRMTFTTPLCPFGEILVQSVEKAVRDIGFESRIEITFEPAWSLDKIKPEIREQFMFPIDDSF